MFPLLIPITPISIPHSFYLQSMFQSPDGGGERVSQSAVGGVSTMMGEE